MKAKSASLPKIDFQAIADEFRDLNPNDPGAWPALPKSAFLLAIFAVLVVAGWWFLWSDQLAELEVKEREEATLKQQFLEKKKQAVNLDLYLEQLAEIDRSFGALLKQLPNKSEIPTLLENISALGNASGLQFKLFKPRGEVPKNFYAEIPVDIQIEGRYRDIITFFESVSKMPRIVNITNINMQNKQQKDTVQPALLATSCNAVTYKFLENAESTKADNTKAKGK